jgi:hypothetical protein
MDSLKSMLPPAVAMFLLAGSASAAQAPKPAPHTPMVLDWSSHQAAFRNPQTPEEARAGGNFARWQRLASDPRFMMALAGKLQAQADARDVQSPAPRKGSRRPRAISAHRDWSNVLGGGIDGAGGSGTAGVYPAKFSFDINAAPDCVSDFVVFPTGAQGAPTSLGTGEFWGSSFTNPHSVGTLRVGKYPPRSVTILTSTTFNDGLYAKTGGPDVTSANTTAANLAAAINRWTGQTGITAEAVTNQVHITSDTTGNQVNDLVAENLSNFGPLQQNDGIGTPGMPSIIGFNQLYDGSCAPGRRNALSPNVLFSYNTGGAVRTSPVLSYFDDGQQLAFVQSSGGQAELVLLKWHDTANGLDAARPLTPDTASSATEYRNESGPCATENGCMFKIPLGANDSWSSPFVDYSADTLYVGTNDGVLHKITGVFSGLPAQVVTGGFPAVVSAGNALSSPVYDFNGSVFVGSASAVGSGGALHRVNASTGAVASSAKLTSNVDSPGVRASPMLDVSARHVYAFVFNAAGSAGTNCDTAPCRAVVDFATDFAAGSTGNRIPIGSGVSATRVQYNGAFDSAWYGSFDSTGSLYVCGGAPEDSVRSVLWKVPIAAGVLGTAIRGATVSGIAGSDCSPMTDVKSGADEFLYLSMAGNGEDGTADVCNGPCVYMFNLANLAPEVKEQWVFAFSGNVTATGGTVLVNGATLTAGTTQACPIFDISGIAARDADNLTACIDALPGFSANRRVRQVTVTRDVIGDVPDSTVAEGVDMANFAQSFPEHVNGSSNTWASSNAPAAGIQAIGGAGGIIIDNISSLPGASRIYYANLGPITGNATQVSQSDLK